MLFQTAFDTFKTTLKTARRFDRIWDAFFDLAEYPEFLDRSRPARLEHLDTVVIGVCKMMLGQPKSTFHLPLVLQYADSGFYHGLIQGRRHAGSFLYFKELDTGLISLADETSQKTDFCRFQLAISESPPGSVGLHTEERRPTLH